MITKFGSLFAGHVDLDDEGLDGTAANDRWLPDERLAAGDAPVSAGPSVPQREDAPPYPRTISRSPRPTRIRGRT